MLLSNKRISKALIRLRGCAAWSASVLFATPRSQAFSHQGPIMLMTYISAIVQKAWRQLNINYLKILTRSKIGKQTMALNFPNKKHNVYISVSCESNMMILFYIYMDHLFQLKRNLISLALFLIENSALYSILNISKLNV